MSSREEVSYIEPRLIALIRERLLKYLDLLTSSKWYETIYGEGGESRLLEKIGVLNGKYSGGWGRIGVVDGGSNILFLNAGYIGIVVSTGIVIEDNRVVDKVFGEPEIIPGDPSELVFYETSDKIESVIDKVREAKVFETAIKLLSKDIDLLVIDGPLIPYGALAKKIAMTPSEENAWDRYHRAVIDLHSRSLDKGVSVIGFVKRPRSQFLCKMIFGLNCFDHVMLSKILKPSEYYPEPPREPPLSSEYIHEEEVLNILRNVKPRYTYVRFTDSTPSYRVDFGGFTSNYLDILNYLYGSRTHDGIPYIIMKVDEETKITKKLLRELYEDVLHTYIFNYMGHDLSKLIPLLPEYGGV